ncbi:MULTISPECIES: spore cortex biosynthesis protein YabQ [Metabacillus]|jgi:spore cortex biosynthesis protein YabQ|uniref:Spore cortex biosynthesis protein YabQ n=2 Tax=Metabacillus TaxID=2675233 RepID=A0A179SWG5_9BACI|nr:MULTISPECIES: spore cortex biosynthesis protein YabQ [Metabacillus]OAS85714.1 spore cortex biosynthesis protein YabQ [Metabacillus litoralis]QNF27737.1 spore cortex biosynthesis protein YabQ [Metabacillus sp. KUDC1714]
MTLTTQFYTMLAMVGMGGWIGVALDTYGRFLKRPLRARWVIFINDFMFWVVQGLILFYLLLLVNEGELRIYIFLAVLCGYAAYQSLLKGIYIRVLERLIQTSLSIYRFMLKVCHILFVKPIVGLVQLIIVVILGTLNFLWRITKWAFQILYSLVKILLAPVRVLVRILWKLVPFTIRNFLTKNIVRLAGFSKKIKNIASKIKAWWLRIKKK